MSRNHDKGKINLRASSTVKFQMMENPAGLYLRYTTVLPNKTLFGEYIKFMETSFTLFYFSCKPHDTVWRSRYVKYSFVDVTVVIVNNLPLCQM